MTGGAGGLSRRPVGAVGATLEAGAPFVLDALDFDQRMRASRAVVTGEGKLDEQTLQGKLVGEIGTRTRQAGVPLHAIVGTDALDGFGKRMIDLQMVQEATNIEELRERRAALATARLGEPALVRRGERRDRGSALLSIEAERGRGRRRSGRPRLRRR